MNKRTQKEGFKKVSGTVVRSTVRAVPATVPDTFLNPASRSIILAVLCLAAVGFGPNSTAQRKVKEGIRYFQTGDFQAAGKAFAEADVARPDDLRIAFDRACAYAATNDSQKAKELFQKSALSRETNLAVRSHYNLGCLAAGQAHAIFPEKPVEATPDQRSQGLSMLANAVGHYRDCLKLEPDHRDARHNLEIIRLWIKQMQALWNEQDRQKARSEMNLLQFLAMLQARQTQLRNVVKSLSDEPDSPKRRQAMQQIEASQRELSEECEPLKQKIKAELQPPNPAQAGKAQPSGPSPEFEQALQLLDRLADESSRSMQRAADQLAESAYTGAVDLQRRVLDNLNQIYMVVASFSDIVQKALSTQQGLLDRSRTLEEAEQEEQSADYSDLSWNQAQVAQFGRLLPLKATAELTHLDAQAAALNGAQDDRTGPAVDPQAAQKQIEGLRASMNKAIELGPQVEKLAQEAADSLSEEKVADALPKQQRALVLLQEIADPLPKQEQPNQEDKNQQQQQQQQQQQKNEQQQTNQPQQQQPRRDLSREQALSVLRRVRERERKHREMQKNLQQFLAPPLTVDRDW